MDGSFSFRSSQLGASSASSEIVLKTEHAGGGGDGSGGIGGNGDGEGGGGNGDDDDNSEKPSSSFIAKVVASTGALPKDFELALKAGTLTKADLLKWQEIRAIPVLGFLASIFQGFRERLMGNPRLLLALGIEELIGGSAKMTAEVKARGENFSKELPLVASDMALELICNFAVVWLLSPKRILTPQPTDRISKAIASLPGHFLQVGNYSWGQRIGNIGLRFVQFSTIGVATSAIGHGLVVASLRNDEKAQEQLAPVHKVAIGWGTFMAVSTNMRYQLVNCWEERVLEVFVPNKALNTLVTFFVRFGNCYLGGEQWIWASRRFGIQ